jgi:hypothetical protein
MQEKNTYILKMVNLLLELNKRKDILSFIVTILYITIIYYSLTGDISYDKCVLFQFKYFLFFIPIFLYEKANKNILYSYINVYDIN